MTPFTLRLLVAVAAGSWLWVCDQSFAKEDAAAKVEHGQAQPAGLQERLAILKGAYSNIVTDPRIFSLFPRALIRDRKLFEERVEVYGPIRRDGRFYFGDSCKIHRCTGDDAAWTIDAITGKATAVISQTNDANRHTFRLYGASSIAELPLPLVKWGQQEGMTSANSFPAAGPNP